MTVTRTRLSGVSPKFALGIAWAGRLLAIVFTVLCTVLAGYLALSAWQIQPTMPSDTDAGYTAGIAVVLGLLGVAFSAMATAARALPPWWIGTPVLIVMIATMR